jgi:outer membrane putative beta-barrel porin/alpha-amylase
MSSRSLCAALAAACTILCVAPRSRACSVCQCGDPIYNQQGGAGAPAETFSFYLEGSAFTKSSGVLADTPGEVPEPGDRDHSFDRSLTAYASWTPTPRVTLTAAVPFRWITIDTKHADGESDTASNRGFGDASFYVSTRLWSDLDHHPTTWLELRGMVKAPTGKSDKTVGGDQDPHLQVGTGSWDFGFGLSGGHHFDRFALYANAFYRINTLGSLHYEYGDVFLANLIATSEAVSVEPLGGVLLRPGLELNYRYAGHDQFQGDFYRSSGGSIANLTPFLELPFALRADVPAPWLRLAVRMPLSSGGLFGAQHESFTYLVGVGVPF